MYCVATRCPKKVGFILSVMDFDNVKKRKLTGFIEDGWIEGIAEFEKGEKNADFGDGVECTTCG